MSSLLEEANKTHIAYITHSMSPPKFFQVYHMIVSADAVFQNVAMLQCNPNSNCLKKTGLSIILSTWLTSEKIIATYCQRKHIATVLHLHS